MLLAKYALATVAAATVSSCGSMAALADCPALLGAFDKAVTSKSLDDAKMLEKRIYLDDVCSSEDAKAKDRIVAAEVDLLGDPATSKANRETILADLRNPTGWLQSWTIAARVADRLFVEHDFAEATAFYDRTIALAGNPSAMSDRQKRDVMEKASAAKTLASDDDQGRHKGEFAETSRSADGALGGIYARSMRGVVPIAIPLPINFIYNSTDFSPVGEKAAVELGDYLKQQQIANITLIGHTDARGPDDYNVKLSQARVQHLAEFLAQHGVDAHVTAIGKGWHDPLDVSRLPYKPDQDETWALNRRVELVR